MKRSAIITGIGLVTPLGECVDSTWENLLAGRSIRDHARVPGLAGGSPSRIFQIACRAADAAAGGARVKPDALVVGTSKGEADAWIANRSIPPAGIGDLSAQLGAYFGIPGPRLTISAACASGLQALIRGVLLLAGGDANRVLVVAAESSLHPMFLENYRRLGVLAPEGFGCRPFDEHRQGFCLSESAAAVVLEASDLAGVNHHPLIAVESFGFGCDATHLTGSDPTGKPLRNLLARVAGGRQIDLVHAHGTGTVANDPVELQALEHILADHVGPPPVVYSHKGALGHSLGAAGLISIVLNVLMHRRGIVPSNVNTRHPLPTDRITIPTEPTHRPIRRSLAVAAGFGGALAAASLATIE